MFGSGDGAFGGGGFGSGEGAFGAAFGAAPAQLLSSQAAMGGATLQPAVAASAPPAMANESFFPSPCTAAAMVGFGDAAAFGGAAVVCDQQSELHCAGRERKTLRAAHSRTFGHIALAGVYWI